MIQSYLVRKTRAIAAPSAGESLGKLFTELRHQLPRIHPLCAQRLLENLAPPSLLAGETRRKLKAEIGTHPDVMVLSPTMRCNLACSGCYSAHYDRHDDLSTADLDHILEQARGIGIHFVVVSGGSTTSKRRRCARRWRAPISATCARAWARSTTSIGRAR